MKQDDNSFSALFYALVFYFFLFGCLAFLVSCASTNQPSFEASVVLERMNDVSEAPKFATKAGMDESGSDVTYTSIMVFGGNTRQEACIDGTSLKAKSNFVQHIKSAITTNGQLNELSGSDDPGIESLTAYLSQNKLSGMKTVDEYWERVVISDESGSRVLKIRCAAKVSINKSILSKQLKKAINGAPDGNPEIRAKLLDASKKFIENSSNQDSNTEKDME